VAPERARVAQQAPARRRRSLRPQVASAVVLIVVAALLVGLYAGTRQFWFVGTNDRGQVSLYRGVPYDLPFGIPLYTKQYQSSVPASAISDPRQRSYDINHQLRSRGDAVALIRYIESGQTRP